MPALAAGLASSLSYVVSVVVGTAEFSFLALGKAFLVGAVLGAVFQALAPGQRSAQLSQQARRVEFNSIARRRVILGQARVSGLVCFAEVTGTGKTRSLHYAIAIGSGPHESIDKVWIDGQEITYSKSGRVLTGTGDYAGYFTAYQNFASDGSQSSELVSNTSATSAFRLNGVSWVYVRLTQNDYADADDRVWKSARPRIEFLVKGLKFTHPLNATTKSTPEWTRNAAACHYWRLKHRKGVSDDAIDEESYIAAYNVCNATVTTPLPGGAQYAGYKSSDIRYAIDGVVYDDEEEQGLIEDMNAAWQSYIIEHSGTFYFRAGANRPATDVITPADILSTGDFQAAPQIQNRVTSVAASTPQGGDAHQWLEYRLPYVKDEAAIRRDGRDYPLDLGSFRFVSNPISLQRLARMQLARMRAAQTWSFVLSPGTSFHRATIKPLDILLVTDDRSGLDSERLEVVQTVMNTSDFTWGVTLRSAPETIYTDDTETPPPLPV